MCGREQQPCHEREMINEESKLGLIACPVRWSVESETEEYDINGGEQCRLGEEGSAEKTKRQDCFEQCRKPSQDQGCRKSCCSDVTR